MLPNESLPQQFLELLRHITPNSREVTLHTGQSWTMASAAGIYEAQGIVHQFLPFGQIARDLIEQIHEISLSEITRQIPLGAILGTKCKHNTEALERTQLKALAACRVRSMHGSRIRNWQVVESILLSPAPGEVDEYILLSREYFESLCVHGDPIRTITEMVV